MNFNKGFNIKKMVMYLLVIMLVSYGLGALILFGTSGNLLNGSKSNYTIDDTKTSNLDDINEIKVDVSSATINIISEGSSDVKAHFHGNIMSSSSYTKPELQCYKDGNTLLIKVVTKTHMTFGFFSSNVKLDVYIPSIYSKDLKLECSSGDININKFTFNKLQCNLSSGRLKMNDINADTFSYSNSSGDLEAEKLTTKTTTLDSSSGSINISSFTGDLKSKSSSGNTKIEYADFNNNIEIDSSSGGIVLKLPKSAEFKLDAKTSSGDITCDFPISVSGKKNEHTLQGTVVSDKNKINLEVSSGDIKILQ